MALLINEIQDLKAVLTFFFPGDGPAIQSNTPNEETLELTEKFLFEVNKCSNSIQTLIDYLGAGRLNMGGLRQRALKAIADATRRREKRLDVVLSCANVGRAYYRRPIMDSFTI
jgi:hypothetical protein